MGEPFNFDLNLDFLNEVTENAEENVPVETENSECQFLPEEFEDIANKINNVDNLVMQFKSLKEEYAKLQRQTRELSESAISIQSMYEKEKAERAKHAGLCEDLQERCNRAEAQLANKTLLLEQVSSQVEKGPISYNELALRYQRLAQHLDEDKQLNSKEKTTLQQIQEYIATKRLSPLNAFKKKVPPKKQTSSIAIQHNSAADTNSQGTQCANLTKNPTTSSKETQCSPKTKSIGTNTATIEAPHKETKTQGTQYISSLTTRGTSTSTYFTQHSVGTNFPEVVPISIDDILKEMIIDIIPIEPIEELSETMLQFAERPLMVSVGTNTSLKNVRKPIDYVSASIKHSNSRPPSRNIYDRIKNEPPSMGMSSLNNLYVNSSQPVMQSSVSEVWNMLGQTLFTFLQNVNPAFNSNLANNRAMNLAPDPSMAYYEEDNQPIHLRGNHMASKQRHVATSPTPPVDPYLMGFDSGSSHQHNARAETPSSLSADWKVPDANVVPMFSRVLNSMSEMSEPPAFAAMNRDLQNVNNEVGASNQVPTNVLSNQPSGNRDEKKSSSFPQTTFNTPLSSRIEETSPLAPDDINHDKPSNTTESNTRHTEFQPVFLSPQANKPASKLVSLKTSQFRSRLCRQKTRKKIKRLLNKKKKGDDSDSSEESNESNYPLPTAVRKKLPAHVQKEFFGSETESECNVHSPAKDLSPPNDPHFMNGAYVNLPDVPQVARPRRRQKKQSQRKRTSSSLTPDSQTASVSDSELRQREESQPSTASFENDESQMIPPVLQQTNQVSTNLPALQLSDLSNSDCNLLDKESLETPTNQEPSDGLKSHLEDDNYSTDDSERDLLIDIPQTNTSPSLRESENDEELNNLIGSSRVAFQQFVDNLLSIQSVPERPVSAIPQSEPSEAEQSPAKIVEPSTRKRKHDSLNTELCTKRVTMDDAARNSLLVVPGIQLGKYTTKTDEPNEVLKKLEKFTRRKTEVEDTGELEIDNTESEDQLRASYETVTVPCLGFFKDVFEESGNSNVDEQKPKKKDDALNNSEEIDQYCEDFRTISDNNVEPNRSRPDTSHSANLEENSPSASFEKKPVSPSLDERTALSSFEERSASPSFEERSASPSFGECPASPPAVDQQPDVDHEVITVNGFNQKENPRSFLSSCLANYNVDARKSYLSSFTVDQKLLTQVQNLIQALLSTSCTPDDITCTIDDISAVTTCNNHICQAFVEIVKEAPPPETELTYAVPDLYLSTTLRKMISFCQAFTQRNPDLNEHIKSLIDRTLFGFTKEQRDLSLECVMNLTKFYLALIADPTTPLNPARLFIYKSLYCYNLKAVPMVYEALCIFPAVLPKRDNPRYNRSNALVSAIQCVLMNTWYNLEKSDLKTKKILTKLRIYYGYETLKPSREEVISNLISKINANRPKDVPESFALICKRMDQKIIEKDILKQRLLPLAMEWYKTLKNTKEHDDKIVCLLQCISLIIKPFSLDSNIDQYRNLFRMYLYACDRQNVQEAAVQAILRTERFGVVSCFAALYDYRPDYEVSELTRTMIDTLIFRKRIGFLHAIEKEIRISH